MSIKRIARIIAALLVVGAVSSCTKLAAGTAVVSDLSRGYTGPELNTLAPVGTRVFTPGTEIRIGVGKNAVTCTAGWIVSLKGMTGVLTAGQCARSGIESPVSYVWVTNSADKVTRLGVVANTTFTDPYNHSARNLAIIAIETANETSTAPYSPLPDLGRVPVEGAVGAPGIEDAKELAAKDRGGEVCWYSRVTESVGVYGMRHCGAITAGGYGKVMVKPVSSDGYSPVMNGAPAVWDSPYGEVVPVGVVTDFYRGNVIIDTIGKTLHDSGAHIVLGV